MHAAMDVEAARCEEWLKHPPDVALKAVLISQFGRPDCQSFQNVIGEYQGRHANGFWPPSDVNTRRDIERSWWRVLNGGGGRWTIRARSMHD